MGFGTPQALETPVVEELPAAPQAEPVAEVQAVEEEQDDPAIAEALIEADVLVKYGLATKAIEQLERLAQRFPESMQLRVKLRDLHGDQGQMRKAAAHMLVMSDLYTKRGMRDQAEEVLRSALDIDPSNAEVSARLGVAPAPGAAGSAAVNAGTGPSLFEDFTSPEDLSEEIAGPALETANETTAPPLEETPSLNRLHPLLKTLRLRKISLKKLPDPTKPRPKPLRRRRKKPLPPNRLRPTRS